MAETSELQGTPDLDAQKARLIQETASVLELDRSSPEFTQGMLNLMDQLEKAREILGPFCATVGEGEDRAIVFTNPSDIKRVSSMVLDIEPDTDYGPVRTTYKERLLVNKGGVYALTNVKDQKLDYDPRQRLPTTTIKKREFDPSRLEDWASRRSAIAQYYGADSERVLASILASGRYPEITIKQPISGTGEHLTPEQNAEYRKQLEAYSVGQSLSPNILFPQPPTDVKREAQLLRGWYTGGFDIYSVTRPERVMAAFQNIPQPQSTPQLAAA